MMKLRKDIKEFLVKKGGTMYDLKFFRFYEKDNLLYQASYNSENKNRIEYFTDHSNFTYENTNEFYRAVRADIEKKFKVKFAEKGCDIICRCGESKNFTAFYGNYELLLRCNSCQNTFSAYSG